MILQRLRIRCFRNLDSVDLVPHPGFNVLHGSNGHGKTNLLEAIHFLSTLRSFRALRNRELLQQDEPQALVEGDVDRGGRRRTLQVHIDARSRRVRVNGKAVQRLAEFFGTLNTVVFTPQDVALLRSTPQDRRLLLDRFIFNASPTWADDVATYEQALRQRNALLKTDAPDRALVQAFDEQLARSGARVLSRRMAWLERLREPVSVAFGRIFGRAHDADLAYVSSVPLGPGQEPADVDALQHALQKALDAGWRRDLARGFTTVGPHRDDFEATLDGQPVRSHASQGQQRAFILAFRIAEIRLLTERHGHPPILLLDDVTSEFDAHRNVRFFDVLREERGQVFITTTDPAWVPLGEPACHWAIECGTLTPTPESPPPNTARADTEDCP